MKERSTAPSLAIPLSILFFFFAKWKKERKDLDAAGVVFTHTTHR